MESSPISCESGRSYVRSPPRPRWEGCSESCAGDPTLLEDSALSTSVGGADLVLLESFYWIACLVRIRTDLWRR